MKINVCEIGFRMKEFVCCNLGLNNGLLSFFSSSKLLETIRYTIYCTMLCFNR